MKVWEQFSTMEWYYVYILMSWGTGRWVWKNNTRAEMKKTMYQEIGKTENSILGSNVNNLKKLKRNDKTG